MTTLRRRLTPLAVSLLIIFILAPGTVAAADEQSFEGTLLVAHGDDLDANGVARGQGIWEYRLETAAGTVALAFAGGNAPEGFTGGAHVRVRGNLAAGTVAVGGPNAATVVEPATVAAATSKKIALLLVNFIGKTTQPWTTAQAQGILFSNTNSVANYFGEESYGQMSVTGDVFGYYTLDVNINACDFTDIGNKARAAATAAGVNLNNYTNVQYAFPSLPCGWSGLAYVPGRDTWINNALGLYVSAHELSHNFGVHHASTISCTEGGVRVALSSNLANCSYSEYGDPFSVMGNGSSRHTHNQQLASLGWLSGGNLQTVTATGTYSLTSADDAGTAVKAIRVARGNGTYVYIELRQPVGSFFDNFGALDPAVNGLTLRVSSDWGTITQSKLIDTTPATTSYNDAPLGVGASFTDPLSGVSVTTVSIASRAAQVLISWGGGGGGSDTTAPSTPGSLVASMNGATASRLTWTASTDNVGVTGYEVRRGGVLLATVAASPYDDSGPLVLGATYGYTVTAVDAAGNHSTAASASLVVPNPDTTAPSVPGSLVATMNGATASRLTWTASTDNVGVTGYQVRRDGVLLGTVAGSPYDDSGPLAAGATYAYTVTAVDAAGNPSGPASASLVVPNPDTTAPSAPTSLRVVLSTKSKTTLAWNASTDNVAVAGYRLYRNGALVATTTNLSWADSRQKSKGASYYVVAFDAAGNISPASSLLIVPVTIGTAPTQL
jgi:fibronectin type 3 domain-containing protein